MIVIPKIIKRIKKLLNVLNYVYVHSCKTTEDLPIARDDSLLVQIKNFVCEICDIVIERF
jgi:hypothetical protein